MSFYPINTTRAEALLKPFSILCSFLFLLQYPHCKKKISSYWVQVELTFLVHSSASCYLYSLESSLLHCTQSDLCSLHCYWSHPSRSFSVPISAWHNLYFLLRQAILHSSLQTPGHEAGLISSEQNSILRLSLTWGAMAGLHMMNIFSKPLLHHKAWSRLWLLTIVN